MLGAESAEADTIFRRVVAISFVSAQLFSSLHLQRIAFAIVRSTRRARRYKFHYSVYRHADRVISADTLISFARRRHRSLLQWPQLIIRCAAFIRGSDFAIATAFATPVTTRPLSCLSLRRSQTGLRRIISRIESLTPSFTTS